jgi:O-antigen/teichoic acid export membrane protein
VLGLAFDPIFSVPHGLAIDAAVLMFLTGLVTSLSLLGDTAVAALAGLQRYDLLNLTLLLLYALQAIGWVIALALHTGLVGLGVGSVCAAVVFLAVRVRYAHKLLPEFDMNASHADRATARRLTSLSVWLAVSQASWLVLVQIDVLVVGLVAGVPAAGIYAVGQKLATAVDRLTRPAMTGFFTHAAQLTARDDQSGLGKSLQAGIRLGLGIGMPFAIAIALFAEPAVRAWAGRSYTDAALVVVYLALANVVLSAVRPGFMLLGGSGRARSAALLAASEALLNLGLSIALGLWIGLTGVALGTLIATIAVRGCVSLPYIGRTFGVYMLGLVRTVVTAHAAPSAAAVALALLIRAAALPDLVAFLVGGGAVVAVYLLVFAFTGLSREERAFARSSLRALGGRLTPRGQAT